MKREVKFRGFNKKNNKWLYGDLIHNRGLTLVCPVGIADPFATWEDFVVEPDSVGQFTGLYDFEGKEVYEWDIINDGEFSHIVSYSLNDARFVVIRIEHFTDEIERVMNMNRIYQERLKEYDKKVIGNIHDNPELMERKSNH